ALDLDRARGALHHALVCAEHRDGELERFAQEFDVVDLQVRRAGVTEQVGHWCTSTSIVRPKTECRLRRALPVRCFTGVTSGLLVLFRLVLRRGRRLDDGDVAHDRRRLALHHVLRLRRRRRHRDLAHEVLLRRRRGHGDGAAHHAHVGRRLLLLTVGRLLAVDGEVGARAAAPQTEQQRRRRGGAGDARPDASAQPRALHADGAIRGDDGAVEALIEAHAQAPFLLAHERLARVASHRREVVDVLLALAAEAHALVAYHVVPVGRARRGDADLLEHHGQLRLRLRRRRRVHALSYARDPSDVLTV